MTLRTHNPRMYSVAASLAKPKNKAFPNFEGDIPQEVLKFSKKNHFINDTDENLVVKGAYPDEKIQQPVSDKRVTENFKNSLGPFDAQAVIVHLN